MDTLNNILQNSYLLQKISNNNKSTLQALVYSQANKLKFSNTDTLFLNYNKQYFINTFYLNNIFFIFINIYKSLNTFDYCCYLK